MPRIGHTETRALSMPDVDARRIDVDAGGVVNLNQSKGHCQVKRVGNQTVHAAYSTDALHLAKDQRTHSLFMARS